MTPRNFGGWAAALHLYHEHHAPKNRAPVSKKKGRIVQLAREKVFTAFISVAKLTMLFCLMPCCIAKESLQYASKPRPSVFTTRRRPNTTTVNLLLVHTGGFLKEFTNHPKLHRWPIRGLENTSTSPRLKSRTNVGPLAERLLKNFGVKF